MVPWKEQKIPRTKQIEVALFKKQNSLRVTLNKFRSFGKNKIYYFVRKFDKGIKWGTHGGLRSWKVQDEEYEMIKDSLEILCNECPTMTLPIYKAWILQIYGKNLSTSWISNILYNKLNLSRKKIVVFNRLKYSSQNMEYYSKFLVWLGSKFLVWLGETDISKIRVADESMFDGRHCKTRFGRSKKGSPCTLVNSVNLTEKVCVTLLISMEHETPHIVIRDDGTNDDIAFLEFVIGSIESGYLSQGTILLIDNARIHCSESTSPIIEAICREAGVQIKRLPVYSPELSPCELVFGLVKNDIYQHGTLSGNTLREDVVRLFGSIPRRHILNFYKHCLIDRAM
jgi:transposase